MNTEASSQADSGAESALSGRNAVLQDGIELHA